MKLVVPSDQKISTMQTCIDIRIGLSFPTNWLWGLYVASSSSVSAVLLMGSVKRVKNDYVWLERQSVAAAGGWQPTGGAGACQRQQQ